MSLFKAREFWTTNSDGEESFDQNCLLVHKLNSDSDYVITGSHSGVIRIFKPSNEPQEEGKISGYRPSDLVLESAHEAPILQVSCGKLISGTSEVQLAVLQPRTFRVYGLTSKEGETEHGDQHNLKLVYEHKLRRSAANFVVGPFGGSQNRDFVCVQSLDGLLTFFEQESFGFCCFIPNFLLPSPMVYLCRADVFVTGSADWQIVSYGYKHLSEVGEDTKEDDVSGKKLTSTWSTNIGEAVLDVRAISLPHKESLLVLGERNLYCLTGNGRIAFMKRLEYTPLCFTVYTAGEDDKIMTLITSETNTLLLYQNATLKWSARLEFPPVAVNRVFLKHIKGAIVTLSAEGRLSCSYLGTEPSVFIAPPLHNQQLDFEKTNEELAKLTKIIRDNSSEPSLKTDKDISVTVRLKSASEDTSLEHEHYLCTICADLTPRGSLEEVHVTVSAQKPLKVTPPAEFYSSLNDRQQFEARVLVEEESSPFALQLDVIVTYMNSEGLPRVVQETLRVPLSAVMELATPQKENDFKIVMSVNQSTASLSVLFEDFSGEISAHSVAFQSKHENSPPVTILLAKSSERYRIQCNSILPLAIVVDELIHRLKKHFSDKKDFKIIFASSLPVASVVEYMGKHFQARQRVVGLERSIAQLGGQYRLVQKRLIAKFKAKNPTPLTHLDLLVGDTYDDIMRSTGELEEGLKVLYKTQTDLCMVLSLLINLMRIMDVNQTTLPHLEATFCQNVQDIENLSWEDYLDASLCFLLRTVLAKSEKDKLRAPHTSFEELKEIAKVEKHLTQVLERITKSGRGLETSFNEEEEGRSVEEVAPKEVLPIGSQIGEASSRILSARKGLLKRRQIQMEEES